VNQVPIHPALVHVPLGLAIGAPVIAVAILVAVWRGWLPARAWLVVAIVQVLMVGGAFVAVSTGEKDEEKVEKIVPEEAMEEHEESGKWFQWAALIACVVSLVVVVAGNKPVGRPAMLVATILTMLVAAAALRTGQLGGKLIYVHGGARAHTGELPPADTSRAEDHD
jgi:uncharacterized membrane protein